MIRLFLRDARRQKRSILEVCEHFGDRSVRAKRANQNNFYNASTVRVCAIFADELPMWIV